MAYSTATTSTTVAPFKDLPLEISDHFGRKLQLRYNDSGQLIKLIDPAGGEIKYDYNTNRALNKVTWQDNTARQYLYEAAHGKVTGIIDELGTRISAYTYDSQNGVTTSMKAGGAERLDFI